MGIVGSGRSQSDALPLCVFRGKGINSTVVQNDAWHHLSDAITSAFVFVGISVALWTRNAAADDWAALCASPVIMLNAWRQLRAPFAELLDTAPAPRLEHEVRRIASTVSGVIGLEKCHVRKMGWQLFADMHIEVDPQMTVQRAHEIAHHVKDQVRQAMPSVYDVLVHVEPGAKRVKK